MLVAAKVLLDLSTAKSRRSLKEFSVPPALHARKITSPVKEPKKAAKSVVAEHAQNITPTVSSPAESKTTLQGIHFVCNMRKSLSFFPPLLLSPLSYPPPVPSSSSVQGQ